MQELIRLFTKRRPIILNQNSINSLGIQTHPENFQSARFKNWQILCKANNHEGLKTEMLIFLQSKYSIKILSDLGKEWNEIIPPFFAIGNQISKEKSYQIINEAKVETVFGKDKSLFINQFTALADTILSLSYLKNLGHKDNIDYQSAIKVMAFTKRCIESKMHLPDLNIIEYFQKPILLPSCFFAIDSCSQAIPSDIRFPFLIEQNLIENSESKKGCISSNCTCHENEECVKQSKCCVKPRIDLIDLMVVKYYTKCYKAGDLSFVRNVLEGEILSTKHRRLERTEELIETEYDIKQFEERYLQTEDKTSLHKETEDVLKQDKSIDAGLTTNSSFGAQVEIIKFGFGTNSTTNLSSSQSKTLTNKEVRDYSKDVIDRATKQLEEKVRKLSSIKRIFETEEKNKHRFDNSKGENINGQYTYVNKVSRAQVYNYGKTAVFDLILPEPAALYKRLLKNEYFVIKPVKPAITPTDINSKNYLTYTSQYSLKDIENPPKEFEQVKIHINGEPEVRDRIGTPGYKVERTGEYNRYDYNAQIPINYVSESMSSEIISLIWNPDYNPPGKKHDKFGGVSLSISIGGNNIGYYPSADTEHTSNSSVSCLGLESTQPLGFQAWDVTLYDIILTIQCKIKNELMLNWQKEIYDKIMKIYEGALAEWQKNKDVFEEKEAVLKKGQYDRNPFINREIERAELKRMAISYISCQFYDQFDSMKSKVEPCGYPEMSIIEAEKEGKFVQFFEQAFNWNLLTYKFYPYFWGKKCNWSKNLKEESSDLIFEKFLQAGSCHVLIPIRNGFFDYVSYFIMTGEIWGGTGTTPLSNDPYYVSLAQEIKEQNENFNTERSGRIDATNGSIAVTLNGTDYYWDNILGVINTASINADLDREILLDFKYYRIVSIVENTSVTTHDSWIITLERNYEGDTQLNMMWSTGAIYIGAPWEFVTPTTLTFLREKSTCLPCYPLKECKKL